MSRGRDRPSHATIGQEPNCINSGAMNRHHRAGRLTLASEPPATLCGFDFENVLDHLVQLLLGQSACGHLGLLVHRNEED